MSLLFQVDAFSAEPYRGNPAAVCLMEQEAPAEWMQMVAEECNLSETAFVWPLKDGFGLRWFTPTQEVKLCGHATLASAHILWERGGLDAEEKIVFHTASGALRARCEQDEIILEFPRDPLSLLSEREQGELEPWLSGYPVVTVRKGREDLLVQLECHEDVRALQPPRETRGYRGIIFTAIAAETALHDFVSRFFAPEVGIVEDPVTGSAHCTLAEFWSPLIGRSKLIGFQDSPRGGIVGVELQEGCVELWGKALTMFVGSLTPNAGYAP